jgi:hypothetical protein
MVSAPPPRRRAIGAGIAGSPTALWAAFILTHLWLGFLNLTAQGLPLGDVTLQYQKWAQQADYATYYVGIDSAWVYPIVALIPIVAAGTFGFANYAGGWLSLVFILDLVAFGAMVGWRRGAGRGSAVGWWWIAFLLLLGPISLGRIDSITIPVAIVAVLFLASRPRVAGVLLALATWIKVWPAALIAAILIASKARARVLGMSIVTSVAVIAIALVLGSGANVFSFITQQTGRALQVEAPISSVWMWLAFARVPGAFVYYDAGINTFQVAGPGTDVAAAVMTPVLGLVVVLIAGLGIRATRRGAPVTELLAPLALAFVTALIAFNKVGSPQYITWFAVPVILGLATNATGHCRSFRVPAIGALLIAALTQYIYPYLYQNLLGLQPTMLIALSVRNALVVGLMIWSIGLVWGLSKPFVDYEQLDAAEHWLPTVWPFGGRATTVD